MGRPSHIRARILITKIPLVSVSARSCFPSSRRPLILLPVRIKSGLRCLFRVRLGNESG